MEFLEIAKKRYACRKYSDKKVEKEKLEKILEAGRVAPTAANLQPQKILIMQKKESLDKLGKGANIYNAPLAFVICSDKTKVWKRPFDGKDMADIDASIVTDHMMLEAASIGLNSVWICYFNPEIIKSEFNIPDNLEPINILAIGYSDENRSAGHLDTRKPIEEISIFETF